MKKRLVLLLRVAAVLALLCCLIFTKPSAPKNIPRFVPGRAAAVGNFQRMHYEWLVARPFVNNRMWVWVVQQTNRHCYLYDLEANKTLGELFDAWVILENHDGTKLLCEGPSAPMFALRDWAAKLIERLSGGKINPQLNRAQALWVLDLTHNTSKRVGGISQMPGTGSRWHQSPTGRFACTMPTTGGAFVYFDFTSDELTRVALSGRICGWWDEQGMLVRTKPGDFVRYDVIKGQTTVLFSREQLRHTFEHFELPTNQLPQVIASANWNGVEYDFYFMHANAELSGQSEFLLKASRLPTPELKLVSRDFEFAWGGYFDAHATRYLYQGEKGAAGSGGNGAVLLRDLRDGSVQTLVPPDHKGQYAIPRFYGDEVIYFRDWVVWRIGLDGSNNVPLFQPRQD